MKVLKMIVTSVFCFALLTASAFTQELPDTPTANDDMRIWLGVGGVFGAEDEFKSGENSLAVAGGVYFPSNLLKVFGFYSFLGGVYNVTDLIGSEDMQVTTWDIEYRLIYYLKMSTDKSGLFLLLGPDYQHVTNDDPLAFSGSLFQASTGFGGYIGLGETKDTRLSVVVERDFMGDIMYRDWRVLTGFSKGFEPLNIF